jgi:hypothetical protein
MEIGYSCATYCLAGLVAVLATSPAVALECPTPHPTSRHGVLKETKEMISRTSTSLAQGGAKAAPQVIAGIRARHPHAGNGMIMNYLVTAYCPAVNKRKDLSEAQKRADLMDFNRVAGRLLFK